MFECSGGVRLTITLDNQAIDWDFIVAEIGEDEGFLGNDLAVTHRLTVHPHEGTVSLPGASNEWTENLGERLMCVIVAEIGEDEGILGNDLAVTHRLTVHPHEGTISLPGASNEWTENLGERLMCVIRSITEVRAITEEALAVRATGQLTLAPMTVSQVGVAV